MRSVGRRAALPLSPTGGGGGGGGGGSVDLFDAALDVVAADTNKTSLLYMPVCVCVCVCVCCADVVAFGNSDDDNASAHSDDDAPVRPPP